MIKDLIDQLFLKCLHGIILIRFPRLTLRHWRYNRRQYLPNPVVPKTIHDKWFWRKVFDRSPDFVQVTDKIGLRVWLKHKKINIGTPRIFWQGSRAEDIPAHLLDQGVVIKANHGCAMNIFLPTSEKNHQAIIEQANGFLKKRHGEHEVQWSYFNVKPTLFVEELIPDMTMEFKFYCFGDRIERLGIIYDRYTNLSADIWLPDNDGGFRRSETGSVIAKKQAGRPLPTAIAKAAPIARQLGGYFDHIRVDMLSDGSNFWLGELTVYNLGGHFMGIGDQNLERMNEGWNIERSWFLSTPQSGWRGIYQRALRRRLAETL